MNRVKTLACVAGIALLAGCSQSTPPVQSADASATPPGDDAGPEPSLRDVPPRPRLTYTIEQRREISSGLVRDRELARYKKQESGYDVPQSSSGLVPPPQPATVADVDDPVSEENAATQEEQSETLFAATESIEPDPIQSGTIIQSTSGSLNDLIEDISRMFLEPFQDNYDSPTAEVEEAAAPVPESEALDQFTDFISTNMGLEQVEEERSDITAEPANQTALAQKEPASDGHAVVASSFEMVEPAAPPAPVVPERVLTVPADGAILSEVRFTGDEALLDEKQRDQLLAALRRSDLTSRLLVAEGGGATPGLAMERARLVAQSMVEAGIPADKVSIRAGADGSKVLVHAVANR